MQLITRTKLIEISPMENESTVGENSADFITMVHFTRYDNHYTHDGYMRVYLKLSYGERVHSIRILYNIYRYSSTIKRNAGITGAGCPAL